MVVYLGCLSGHVAAVAGARSVRGRPRGWGDRRNHSSLGVRAVGCRPCSRRRRAVQAKLLVHPPTIDDLWQMLKLVGGANDAARQLGMPAIVWSGAAVALLAGRRWRTVAALAAFGVGPIVLTFIYSRHATSIFHGSRFMISRPVPPIAYWRCRWN